MEANYEALTKKELQEILKQRGFVLPKGAGRKEMLDVLKKAQAAASAPAPAPAPTPAPAPEPGSESSLSVMEGAELVE
jgi:hypothetical protein